MIREKVLERSGFNMNELLSDSVFFGVAISIAAFWIGEKIQQKWKLPVFNPLLIATVLVILVLMLCDIDYETYNQGAQYITFLLTPATICLAVPLYRQIEVLKKNVAAIIISILCGCVAHLLIIIGIAWLFGVDEVLILSFLPKSVTTPIALGISNEIGGIQAVTVVGVCTAGILCAVIGPVVFKIFKVTEPVAQGLGMGAPSHAIGTSKALEMGEIEGAMSSLAIVVTGILTVVIVPIFVQSYF